MISPLDICFRVLVSSRGELGTRGASVDTGVDAARRSACATIATFLVLGLAAPVWAGSVSGEVRLVGSKIPAVKKKHDFSGVVVWLTPVGRTGAPRLVRKHATMIQKDKHFTPHILAIQSGTTVDFPNFDPIFHNAFSNFNGQIFDIGLYPPGTSRSIRFIEPGIVKIFCNIHPSMSATIVVVDSPYFTITDHEGQYLFPDVAPGAYRIHFFHERATAETLKKLSRIVVVKAEKRSLTSTSISEAGYLAVSHKNKYGRDYPDNGDSTDGYSTLLR
jgi:plastocyanin